MRYNIRTRGRHVSLLLVVMMALTVTALHATPLAQKSVPVSVAFGVLSLSPDTPVTDQWPFVSQSVTLPEVVCATCSPENTTWQTEWRTSGVTLLSAGTQAGEGRYLFASGLRGISVSIQVPSSALTAPRRTGHGHRVPGSPLLTLGLVRQAFDTGAGLVDLPPAAFIRVTTFRNALDEVIYQQEDTVQVSADLRVPTCTSTSGGLSFTLPEISLVWMRKNLPPGTYTDTRVSAPGLVVSNCSSNTRTLRIRFLPGGSVSDSDMGPDTLLVARDGNGQESGLAYLLRYQAKGFGQHTQGVVRWGNAFPLVINHERPTMGSGGLDEGITVSLQAYYAHARNGLPLTGGTMVSKGQYQVSYE